MKVATDIYTFSELRRLGFHYVDKTAGILSLVNATIGEQFFCARPRRFGKSLLVTTLQALYAGDPGEMLEGVKCFFENIPYDLQVKYEKYYQSLFHSVFLMLNAQTTAEVRTARGRIDAVVETPDYVYVFEFKLRGTSEEALAQIEEKGYAAKFAADPRKLFKIGCAFDWNKRNLGQWILG